MATLLECQHLCKKFDQKVVLDNVSLTIEKGKIYGLLGKNGAGKSTFIKLINDLLTVDSGKIIFKGKPILPRQNHDHRAGLQNVFRVL